VHLICNIARNATATVIYSTRTCGHQNMQTHTKGLNFYFEIAMNNSLHI